MQFGGDLKWKTELPRPGFLASPVFLFVRNMTPFLKGSVVTVAVLSLLAVAGLFYVNRQLPTLIEGSLNAHVEGYRFTVGQATISPALSIEIRELTMIQTDYPDPPVAEIPSLHLSIQWRHIFSGVLVSDYVISRPTLHIILPQEKKEVRNEVPRHGHGWRDAVYSFYPFEINEFHIEEADVTYYVDQDPSKPLRFTHVNLLAENVHNIRSPSDVYPSDLKLDGQLFGSGRLRIEGHANFLAEPHASINADLVLQDVPLEPLLPISRRYNIELRGGAVSADGHLEYAADGRTEANLKTLSIENARVDYVHLRESTAQEAQVGKAELKSASNLQDSPETLVRIDHGEINHSEFGFVNEAAKPPYRVFLSNGALRFENISNHLSEGSGSVTLTGKFMGTGDTVISGTFRPETRSPDFDLNIRIEKTQMNAMNELLKAYGSFDVTAGVFSLYSELRVKNSRVEGYIKPLFKDLKVYDTRQDKEKPLFHKIYEGLVGSVAKLLENQPREEVATKTEVSGALENPQTNTWQTVVNLAKNAFLKTLLPGFEKDLRPQS